MSELPKFVKFDDDFPEAKITPYPQARRLRLRVARDDGSIRVSVPPKVDLSQITAFLNRQKDWIMQQRTHAQTPTPVSLGAWIPVEGQMYQISPQAAKGITVQGDQLCVSGADSAIGPKVKRYLQVLAQDRLNTACDLYAEKVDKPIRRISLRDTRSRWGSCSAQGAIMFSWRLIMAPPEVLEYVAAHEVAHLVEMNHSSAFWNLVERLYGPSDHSRQWLRNEGASLLSYRFG